MSALKPESTESNLHLGRAASDRGVASSARSVAHQPSALLRVLVASYRSSRRASQSASSDRWIRAELADERVGAEVPVAVSIRNVSKVFGTSGAPLVALHEVSLDVAPGEFVCLVGASGCGKSTLLNLVAGLDQPTVGRVEAPDARSTLLFQEAALFPWLTVAGNVDLALRLRRIPKSARRDRVAELLTLVRLGGFADRRPHELSGGMRQRAALARALAQDADVLLMDEPFGALDAMTRDLLHDELERVWRDRHLTVLFVTHNVREAVRLGDRVLLLSSRPGRVVDEFTIQLPRPRRIESPELATVAAEIIDRLRLEVFQPGH
jgi:NitT/TauT family transport system ATP-binding protein